MTVLIVLLVLAAATLLANWAAHRHHLFPPEAPLAGGYDARAHDRELADLRALRAYREERPVLFP